MFSQKSYQQSSISTEGTTRLASHRVRFGFGKYSPSILDIVATVDSYQKADCKTNMSIRFHGALLVVFMSARASSSGHLPFNMKSGCLIELRVHISELPPARSMKPLDLQFPGMFGPQARGRHQAVGKTGTRRGDLWTITTRKQAKYVAFSYKDISVFRRHGLYALASSAPFVHGTCWSR